MNPAIPQATDTDRLGLALFIALVVHGLVILGIAFGEHLVPRQTLPPTLDVILVQTQSPVAPEDAEFIAQVDQLASGSDAEKARPSAPLPIPAPAETGIALVETPPAAPPRQPEAPVRTVTAEKAPEKRDVPADRRPAPEQDVEVAELIERSLALAKMVSELREQERLATAGVRTHYIDAASARTAAEAAYIDAWVRKVEQIGNLNYPDEVRRRRLSGSLLLSVLIGHDGNVIGIDIASSSGERVLDDAAVRIVELAGPYAPFPPEMRRQYDRLMISRTWVFREAQGVTTR